MTERDPAAEFLDLPDRSWRPMVIGTLVVVGLAITGFRLFFAVTDERRPPTEAGSISRQAADVATHPSLVLPDLEELMAEAELPPGPDGGLSIVESGITVVPDRFDPQSSTGTFALVIDNPHPDWTARSVEVLVDAVTEDGTVVGSARFLVPAVESLRPVAVAGIATDLDGATRLDVAMEVALWEESPPVEGAVVGGEVTTARAPIGGVTSTLSVTSTLAEPVQDVGVVIVHRDADGAIIGGFDTFVDLLSPGETVHLTIDNPADLDPAAIAHTDVYTTSHPTT